MVNTNAIDSNLFLANQSESRAPSSDLGKDEFLKILMTQLQNQDPLDPMDDKDFIAQMATFSSLEQQMNMADSINKLVQNQTVSPVIQNSHMIGKEISYIDDHKDVQTSEVVAISQKNGQAVLELSNGEKIYADIVEKVGQPGEIDDTDDDSDDDIIGEPDDEDTNVSGEQDA